jgi:hypothetical protein
MEEVHDEDAPHQKDTYEWFGEESFWLNDEPEFELNEEEDDETYIPFQEIEDPEGEIPGQADDDHMEEAAFKKAYKGAFVFPPSRTEAEAAFADIQNILKPPRNKGKGYKSSGLDKVTQSRLEGVKTFIGTYIRLEEKEPEKRGNWTKASELSVYVCGGSQYHARKLREWARNFIDSREEIPENQFGRGNKSAVDDEDLAQDIHLHLQSVGKYIKAEDIVQYCSAPDVLERMKRTRSISLITARRWLAKMGYRWKRNHKGQYVDGHERSDVVDYRQNVFLPAMAEYTNQMRTWTTEHGWDLPPSVTCATIVWFHDESTFYAHDRRQSAWYHKTTTPVPYAKGEGVSIMVADFVSADYGWLRSPDGKESARVIFRTGRTREGYFTSENTIMQVECAMEILEKYYPNEDHIFVYDCASTHLKRSDESLSSSKMPRNMSKPNQNFGVTVNVIGENGKPIYGPDGKVSKRKIRMRNGRFKDGTEQEFYYPDGHPNAGLFKGMAQILTERGYDVSNKKAQCGKTFAACPENTKDCCCRRLLYNEPDFVAEEPLLGTCCKNRGFRVLFLPKFHCELNFIEQCWGYAKRHYRLLPPSSKEEELERNVLASLEEVPLISMRRFFTQSLRFMDAYRKGLNGRQAAWAAKKYQGHRVIPETILRELSTANIN